MTLSNTPKIALIGFGEAAAAFATGWGAALAPLLSAYDIKAGDVAARAAALGILCLAAPAAALLGADVALCLVTADQALAAAQACAPTCPPA